MKTPFPNDRNRCAEGLRTLCLAVWLAGLTLPTAAGPLTPKQEAAVEAAIPREAPAKPKKPRRLLIFDLNVNYGGHASIPFANHAFRRMGEVTGAFVVEVHRDPEVFRPASLTRFDAVFLNNTVGNLFRDPELRNSLAEFVWRGGGLMGVHGTTVAFVRWPGGQEDWPEFAYLIGARGANHRENREHVFIKLDDPDHPINAVFGGRGWDYRDEFFRVHEPYSRERLRVLFSIDTEKTDLRQGRPLGHLEREDDDYALAWVKPHGRGRVFYCTIAHHPEVFQDPRMLRFYLAAAQFVLGDLEGPIEPSRPRRFTGPGGREDEAWRLAQWRRFRHRPLSELIAEADRLGQRFIDAGPSQSVSPAIPHRLAPGLSSADRAAVRLALAQANLRLANYVIHPLPADRSHIRELLWFARQMGALGVVTPASAASDPALAAWCRELDLAWRALPSPTPRAVHPDPKPSR